MAAIQVLNGGFYVRVILKKLVSPTSLEHLIFNLKSCIHPPVTLIEILS